MKIDSQLKPCPFCGGAAHFLDRTYDHCVSVFCENQHCAAEIRWTLPHSGYDPKEYKRQVKKQQEAIIKAWNTRREFGSGISTEA